MAVGASSLKRASPNATSKVNEVSVCLITDMRAAFGRLLGNAMLTS